MKNRWLWFVMMGALGTVACHKNGKPKTPDDNDGPMEEAGEWTDEAAKDTKDAVEDAAEETEEAIDDSDGKSK